MHTRPVVGARQVLALVMHCLVNQRHDCWDTSISIGSLAAMLNLSWQLTGSIALN